MGCWDIFCFLCGNTCHGTNMNLTNNDDFLESIKYYESKKKKSKDLITNFKPIYEKYNKNPKLFLDKLNNIKTNTNWLSKCSFLTADNKIIHECSEIECNIIFKDNKGNFYAHGTSDYNYLKNMYGVFIHTDCWKFVKNTYNIELNYSNLPIRGMDISSPKIFDFIDYGSIEKYWNQEFNFIGAVTDSNEELCNSPLKSQLVAKNIKKIISKLKIKNDQKRKGPSVSATFYDNGIYKVGSNGNIWTIKNNKWIELKDTIKTKFVDNNKKKLKIIYIGDINDKPIFVLKNNSNKKISEYEVLTTSSFLPVIS
jgi:hypothetical protein